MNKKLVPALYTIIPFICLFTFMGCSTPTKFDKAVFDMHTNVTYVPMVKAVERTNYVYELALVSKVEQVGDRFFTNSVLQTNITPVVDQVNITNWSAVEKIDFTPGKTAETAASIGGVVGSFFGVGGIASTVIAALWSLGATIRSKTYAKTNVHLAEGIQVAREIIQQVGAQGGKVEEAYLAYLKQQQESSGLRSLVRESIVPQIDAGYASFVAKQIASNENPASR